MVTCQLNFASAAYFLDISHRCHHNANIVSYTKSQSGTPSEIFNFNFQQQIIMQKSLKYKNIARHLAKRYRQTRNSTHNFDEFQFDWAWLLLVFAVTIECHSRQYWIYKHLGSAVAVFECRSWPQFSCGLRVPFQRRWFSIWQSLLVACA